MTERVACGRCKGSGEITTVRRCPSGPNDTKPCPRCVGAGTAIETDDDRNRREFREKIRTIQFGSVPGGYQDGG